MLTKKVQYKTHIQQRRLGQKLYVLETITSLDEAIDLLCDSLTDQEQNDPFAEDLCPYFGILWPAAGALSAFLAERSELFKNKTVLELGCGLGLPSLVATHLGGKVLASDYHPQVEDYFLRNCRHSSIECPYVRLNWRDSHTEIGQFDIVMGSDVLYESKHPHEIAQGLIRFLKPGGKIILSDPGRNYLGPFLNAMKDQNFSEQMELIDIHGKEIFVFIFSKIN